MTETPPLTPAECDLRDYPWMPLDCTRLLTSETWMLGTAAQKVAAFTLWAKSWHQVPAGSLPDNDRMLAILSESGDAWKRVREHALRGWVKCSDGRLYHPVVAEKANESYRLKLAQRARTEAARAAKAQKRNTPTDDPKPPVAMSVTEPATTNVTDDVTGSTRPDQTRTDQIEERKKEARASFADDGQADTERAAPQAEAEPSWPPKPHPSAITAAVGVLTAKLEGRHRDTRLPGPAKPHRSVDEQLAVLVPRAVKANHAPPSLLAEARERLRKGVG